MNFQIILEAHCIFLVILALLSTSILADSKGVHKNPKVRLYNAGEPLSYHVVVSALQCEDFCLRNPLCLGYNYQFCEDEKQCELLRTLGKSEENECSQFVKFRYEDFQKSFLRGCSCSNPYRRNSKK